MKILIETAVGRECFILSNERGESFLCALREITTQQTGGVTQIEIRGIAYNEIKEEEIWNR
jgi:hypothetical protein